MNNFMQAFTLSAALVSLGVPALADTPPPLQQDTDNVMTTDTTAQQRRTGNPVILDVDTGRDDAWQIIGAATINRLSTIVSSYGNIPASVSFENSLKISDIAQDRKDCDACPTEIWEGSVGPLAPATTVALAEIERRALANGNGLANVQVAEEGSPYVSGRSRDFSALKDYIIANGPSDYIVTGPLTNLARLIEEFGEDDIREYIPNVIVMGGSIEPSLAVDFNFKADPLAVENVMRVFGDRMIIVPYDETRKLRLSEEDILSLTFNDEAGQLSRDLMLAHARGWSQDQSILLHDPATLLALEALYPTIQQTVSIVRDGPDAGKLVIDPENGFTVQRMIIPEGEERAATNTILQRYLHLQP